MARWLGAAEEWLDELRSDETRGWLDHFVFERDGRPLGFAQCYRVECAPPGPWSVLPPGTFGIDFLLGDVEDLGRGLGSALVREFARFVQRRRGARRLAADPDPANVASLRALARAGFVPLPGSALHVLEPCELG